MHERTVGSAQLESAAMWKYIEEAYHIGHVICNGRMGTVIKKATHRRTGVHYALKVIRVVETSGQGISRARALKEAQLLSTLDHPNVIRVFGVCESLEEVVLILEYCDGKWKLIKSMIVSNDVYIWFS
jgi:serine/threonine protein kinase